VILFWCLAAVCNLSVVYGLYGRVNGYVYLSEAVRSLYAAVHRTAWAIGVAWVIFACVTGNGGEVLVLLVFADLKRFIRDVIRHPGFTLPRQQWSFLNRFCTGQWHCGACRKTWRLTDTYISVPVVRPKRCPTSSFLTKLNGGLSQLHSAHDAAIAWLTKYGS